MRGEERDPYVILGVARQASPQEVAVAYRRAARETHPDRVVGGSGERFRVVSDAYDLLRDPRRRAEYDRLHPLARSRVPRAGTTVRYAAPGSQHVVLGASPSSASDPHRAWGGRNDLAPSLRRGIAVWWLLGR